MSDRQKSSSHSGSKSAGFTDDERAAMQERAKELKAESRSGKASKGTDGEADVRAKLAEMSEADRAMGERIHEIITSAAPGLSPRTWYGMPAYAKDGKVICFFQNAEKFKARYATLGFQDSANLDEDNMWPTSFALKELTDVEAARITELVKKAVS